MFRLKLLIIFGGSLSLVSCRTPAGDSQLKIVEGEVVNQTEFPATVSLDDAFSGKQTCTGTFIAKDLLITATHCVISNTNLLVYRGEAPHFVYRSKLYHHVGDDYFDVALLQFSKPVAPAVATINFNAPVTSSPVTMVGFGCTVEGTDEGRGVKRKVEMTGAQVFSNEEKTGSVILSNMGTGEPQGGCQGDSGGPLYVDNQVVGILSSSSSGKRNTHADLSGKFARNFLVTAQSLGSGWAGASQENGVVDASLVEKIDYTSMALPKDIPLQSSFQMESGKTIYIQYVFSANGAKESRRNEQNGVFDYDYNSVKQVANVVGLFSGNAPEPDLKFFLTARGMEGFVNGQWLSFALKSH